jgi:hypothetical protein
LHKPIVHEYVRQLQRTFHVIHSNIINNILQHNNVRADAVNGIADSFPVGSVVYCKQQQEHKLDVHYNGPYQIIAKTTPYTCILKHLFTGDLSQMHVRNLRVVHHSFDPTTLILPATVPPDDDDNNIPPTYRRGVGRTVEPIYASHTNNNNNNNNNINVNATLHE